MAWDFLGVFKIGRGRLRALQTMDTLLPQPCCVRAEVNKAEWG